MLLGIQDLIYFINLEVDLYYVEYFWNHCSREASEMFHNTQMTNRLVLLAF